MMNVLINSYPDKPLLPYRRTKIEMGQVVQDLKALDYPVEVKKAGYIIFRVESANGTKGINENYCGFQADSGRWPVKFDRSIAGVVEKVENGTNRRRLFLAFNNVSGCLNMLLDRLQSRGLYVGGTCSVIAKMEINSVNDLARAYKKSWAAGNGKAEPTAKEIAGFESMYKQAKEIFT